MKRLRLIGGGGVGLERLRGEAWSRQVGLFEELLGGELGEADRDLVGAVREQVLGGGKRLRAVLPVAVAVSCGGERDTGLWSRALWAGLGCELLHAASLAHDDVMDGDVMRRDRPTVWAAYGVPQAICVGDWLLLASVEAVGRAGRTSTERLALSAAVVACGRRLARSQALEYALRRDGIVPSMSDYERIAHGKTGALFALCLQSGGIVAGRSKPELGSLVGVGQDLGLCFQIADDVLDIVGDKGRGSRANDLWEGKPSWLVAHAGERLGGEAHEEFRRRLYQSRDAKTLEDIVYLSGCLEATDAVEAALGTLTGLASDVTGQVAAQVPELQDRILELLWLTAQPVISAGPATGGGEACTTWF